MGNGRGVSYVHKIVKLLREAQHLATAEGYSNLLQPGMVKELIIGDILGHAVHKTKHEPDAWNPLDPSEKFEYLCCVEDGTFQLDRMFKAPAEVRAKSLLRITRNTGVFCAVFDKKNPLDVLRIYEIPVDRVLIEVERQLDASRNDISHVGMTIKWCERNGALVYERPPD